MNADELYSNINLRGALPPTVVYWTSTNVMTAADEELLTGLVPLLQATNQDFFVTYKDTTLAASQSMYELPSRNIGGSVDVVTFIDSNGNEGPPLARIPVADIGRYMITTANSPIGFFTTASDINLLPTPASGVTGSIRMWYSRRPGHLVIDALDATSRHTQVATVSSIAYAGGNTTITCSGNHSGFASGATIDITSYVSPFKVRAQDVTVTTMTAGTATIVCNGIDLTSYPYSVVAGDFVTRAGNSYVPQGIPVEWHSLLELLVVARILDSTGDDVGAKSVLGAANRMENRLLSISQPRTSGNPKKINAWR
jgi:hypothetical protein